MQLACGKRIGLRGRLGARRGARRGHGGLEQELDGGAVRLGLAAQVPHQHGFGHLRALGARAGPGRGAPPRLSAAAQPRALPAERGGCYCQPLRALRQACSALVVADVPELAQTPRKFKQ